MSAAPSGLSLKCPVCGAGFRAAAECPRCRCDLTALMRLAARAYHARQEARSALLAGDVKGALDWQTEARRLHRPSPSPMSDRLLNRFAESAGRMAVPATAVPAEAPADSPPAPIAVIPPPLPPPAAPAAEAPPAREHAWTGIASWLRTLWERKHSRR